MTWFTTHTSRAADWPIARDVADLLKGPKGTTVHITILREGADKPLEFAVVRDEIPRYSVDLHFMIKPGIGYMHVSGFNETTEHEVADALDQMGPDLKGLILDLRQNPGGLLNEGVGVAIGSDSQVSRDAVEELRWLEYGQRLRLQRRNVCAKPGDVIRLAVMRP